MNNAPVKNHFLPSIKGKLIILVAYITLFAFFLYMPLFVEFFTTGKTLNVCLFVETISPEAIELFEQKTGIKVKLTYAEMDDYIYARFKVNEGEGYDIVNIADFMVQLLRTEGLLYPLDHSKIVNAQGLYPHLLNKDYDPGNRYSFPHKWYVYGFVYDKVFFNKINRDDMSLDLIYKDPKLLVQEGIVKEPYRICTLDDSRDIVLFAAMKMFGRIDNLTTEELTLIQDCLVRQKSWVESYTVHSVEYFLFADIVPIALTSSNYMRKILSYSDRFDFAIPKEGSMLIMENFAIPKRSKKIEWAHEFINFMLSDEIMELNSTTYGYNSANRNANEKIDKKYLLHTHLSPTKEIFKRLYMPLYPNQLRKKVEEIWLTVGFA